MTPRIFSGIVGDVFLHVLFFMFSCYESFCLNNVDKYFNNFINKTVLTLFYSRMTVIKEVFTKILGRIFKILMLN